MKISKTVTIVKFFEAYESHVSHVIGQANTPLTLITRANVVVAPIASEMAIGQPH